METKHILILKEMCPHLANMVFNSAQIPLEITTKILNGATRRPQNGVLNMIDLKDKRQLQTKHQDLALTNSMEN